MEVGFAIDKSYPLNMKVLFPTGAPLILSSGFDV